MNRCMYVLPVVVLYGGLAHGEYSQELIDKVNSSDSGLIVAEICAGASQKETSRNSRLKVINSDEGIIIKYKNPATRQSGYREISEGWASIKVEKVVWEEMLGHIPKHNPKNPMEMIMKGPKCQSSLRKILRNKVL